MVRPHHQGGLHHVCGATAATISTIAPSMRVRHPARTRDPVKPVFGWPAINAHGQNDATAELGQHLPGLRLQQQGEVEKLGVRNGSCVAVFEDELIVLNEALRGPNWTIVWAAS